MSSNELFSLKCHFHPSSSETIDFTPIIYNVFLLISSPFLYLSMAEFLCSELDTKSVYFTMPPNLINASSSFH